VARAPLIAVAAVAALTTAARGQEAQAPLDACVECHTEQDPPLNAPVKLLASGDIHGASHLSCADCHGGDPAKEDIVAHKVAGYVGRPRAIEVAKMCGRCHSDIEKMRAFNPRVPTDQEAQYRTSQHGKLAASGDVNAATCVSCHGAHGIKRVKDPDSPVSPLHVVATCTRCHADPQRMAPYKIPTDQLARYEKSVHGHARLVERDPGAPACNTCHSAHGSAPSGVASVFDSCGKCHETQAELFEASTHAKALADRFAKHESPSPSCTACHGNHDIEAPGEALLSGERCAGCHAAGSPNERAPGAMREAIGGLAADIAVAETKLAEAVGLGMEVVNGQVEIAAAREALVQSRIAVHAFSRTRLDASIKEGHDAAASVVKASDAALAEQLYRRRGLAVASACLVAFALLLALKARRLGTAEESAAPAVSGPEAGNLNQGGTT
jgi:bacterioferritin-associated ferredoxin